MLHLKIGLVLQQETAWNTELTTWKKLIATVYGAVIWRITETNLFREKADGTILWDKQLETSERASSKDDNPVRNTLTFSERYAG